MSRFALAVLGGVLAQAVLLAAISGMPHHHPGVLTTAVRVVTIGVVGGFLAATATDGAPVRAGGVAGAVVGVAVGAWFWWLVLYGDTVGVFHHLHYALATAGVPNEYVVGVPRIVAAAASVVVAATFTVGGLLGGLAALWRPNRSEPAR